MWTESIQVYSMSGNASSSSSSPLTSFMEKLLVDSYFRSTYPPEYVIHSDNAKLHYNTNVSRSQLFMGSSMPENHLFPSSSLPLKLHQHVRDYQVPSSRSSPSNVSCSTSSVGNASMRWKAISRSETPSPTSLDVLRTSSDPLDSRWNNNLANDDTKSPGCLGLIRPTRNASHDDLTTLSKTKNNKTKGNTKSSSSSSSTTPVEYKKMSIARPKTGLKGRAPTV